MGEVRIINKDICPIKFVKFKEYLTKEIENLKSML